MTFVQTTYGLATFVCISNISAINDIFLTKLLLTKYFLPQQFFRSKCVSTQYFGVLYFVQATYIYWRRLSISAIYQLYWPNCSAWLRLKLNTPYMFTHHHAPPGTLRQQYLSCYWDDFDQTWNIGSWEHLKQIPTVMVTFVSATFVLATFVHIKNNSAVAESIWTKLYR